MQNKKNGLYTNALKALSAPDIPRRMALREVYPETFVPSNQEILDAAKKVYHQNMHMVDTNTLTSQAYALSPDGKPHVAALNNYNWHSKVAAPTLAQPVFGSSIMQPGVAAATQGGALTMTLGISISAQFILGAEGGAGIGFPLIGDGDIKGNAYVAGKLGLDIDVAVNLMCGLWATSPSGLAGDFYGLEVNLDLDVGVSLGIYLNHNLEFYGFAIGIGAGLGGGVTIVGGYTFVF